MEFLSTQSDISECEAERTSVSGSRRRAVPYACKTLVLFGTRPEIIKLAPVVRRLKIENLPAVVVSSGQHRELLEPFLKQLGVETDYDLRAMRPNQTPSAALAAIIAALDEILETEKPDVILVQGDTTTALAGALAGFNRKIAVGHVEAGLRSGDAASPFPEEMNRRLISQLARFHFAATCGNRANLLAENCPEQQIFLTGNPVVDSLHYILENTRPSARIRELLEKTENFRRILLTTHRRESFGDAMAGNLKELRRFVETRPQACLIFPVHPNPNVRRATEEILANSERIFLLEPLDYADFVALMKSAWLIVSDSGGVQEEAPSLGKPLLILRENTERPEAIKTGIARLVGGNPLDLTALLEENYADDAWTSRIRQIKNPFGDGRSAERIVKILAGQLAAPPKVETQTPLCV